MWEERKHKRHAGKLDKDDELRQFVEERLLEDWSPEQIEGRLEEKSPKGLEGKNISYESIYYYIYEKAEKYKKLYKHLRTNRPKRIKQGKRKSRSLTIPKRKSIHDRPEIVNNKERLGDWESDTLELQRKKGNPYISVQYERKTQLLRVHKMKDKSAEETKEALIKTVESVLPGLCQSITFDNGSENVLHTQIKDFFEIETYFCDPFASWQKGGVENVNKLLRQYLPRNTDLSDLTNEELQQIQEKINNRPRKSLNFLTPNEVINEQSGAKKA